MQNDLKQEGVFELNPEDLDGISGGTTHPQYFDPKEGVYMICPNCTQKTLKALEKSQQLMILGYDTGKPKVVYCTNCGYLDANPEFSTDIMNGEVLHA